MYGEQYQYAPLGEKFTGKERDSESGLDYFGARYYGSAPGRFISPDDGSDQDPTDPQSWNLYSYVRNNPLAYTDPDGHGCQRTTYTVTDSAGNVVQHFSESDFSDCVIQILTPFFVSTSEAAQATLTAASNVFNYIAQPRDPNCVSSATAGGAAAGMGSGAFAGLFFGPADIATVPLGAATGYAGGAAIGRIGGLVSCMSSNGGTSGDSGAGRGSGSSARLTKPQQRQTAKYLGMKEVKGLASQDQLVFEKDGRYFSFSNTNHRAGEVFKELNRNGKRIATTDLNFNRIGN